DQGRARARHRRPDRARPPRGRGDERRLPGARLRARLERPHLRRRRPRPRARHLRDGARDWRVPNRATREGVAAGLGLGRAIGDAILRARLPFHRTSILAAAARADIPATAHVAIGTDIIHMHPSADGAAIGEGSLRDFHLLAGVVARLAGGVYLNLGSAVVLPEVFVKALNLARNVGHPVRDLTTIDMDFNRHYRPAVNVVARPTAAGGRGIQLTGHHEIMFPLLWAAVEDALARRR